ncbi:MAG: hypothetical protein ACKVX7_18925 [Planctomycetota bacterium]
MRWFVLLIVLAVGVACGATLAQPDAAPRDRAPQRAAGPSSDATRVTIPVTASRIPPATASDTTLSELAQYLQQVPAKTYDGGDGEIIGTVRTRAGAPVANIRFHCIIWGTTPGVEVIEIGDASLEVYVEQEIAQYHYDRAMMVTTETDADGKFRCAGLVTSAEYHLQIEPRDDYVVVANGDYRRIRPGAGALEFTALPATPATITVRTSDGRPAHGSFIYCGESVKDDEPTGFRYWVTWDPASKTQAIPLDLPFVQSRSSDARSEWSEVSARAGEPLRLDFIISNAPDVTAHVRAPSGLDAEELTARLEPAGRSPSRRVHAATLVVHGRAEFRNVAAGTYELSIVGDGELAKEVVEVGESPVEVFVNLPAPKRQDHIVVRALKPNGAPASDLSFTVDVRTETGSHSGHANSWRQADGAYWVSLKSDDSQPEESLTSIRLHVASSRFGSQWLDVRPGAAPSVELRFTEPAFAVIRLPDEVPLAQCRTISFSVDDAPKFDNLAVSRTRIFGPLAVGECRILMSMDDSIVDRRVVQLVAGENVIEWAPPPLFTVRVIATAELNGTSAMLTAGAADDEDDGDFSRESVFDAQGLLTLTGVPAGHYALHIWRGKQQRMEIDVRGDTTVIYAPEDLQPVMRVSVDDPAGRLARAGFVDRDKIVGIAGVKFYDHMQMVALLSAHIDEEAVEFQLERDGTPTTITVSLKALDIYSRNNLGGRFDYGNR